MRLMFNRTVALVLTAGAIAACSSSGGGSENTTLTITKQGGDAQTATVATELPTLLRVVVQKGGNNKAGETVDWTVSQGSGTLNPASSVTNNNGEATTSWTLGSGSGQQLVAAAVSPTVTATFSATATPGPATSFGKESGDGQSAGTDALFGQVLAARVADQYGNGITDIPVSWSVESGSATLQSGSSVTNVEGLAAMQVTAGPTTGPVVVRATTAAVAGNADFNLTVTLPPVRVTIGDIFFLSVKNNSQNPAVDTAAVGQPVIWTWSSGGHSVQSTGAAPFDFVSSDTYSIPGTTYTIVFNQAGTYQYDCAVHGQQMTGRVVVQ
jgi:plastocyanin